MKEYPDQFAEGGAHGHGLQLLADAALQPGVVLDLGCAGGPLAEQVAELGFEYVGADIDRAALDSLVDRDFEGHELDLALPGDELAAALESILRGRSLVAVLALDVLEHLVDSAAALQGLGRLAASHQGLQLVVSIPNLTHLDVGTKLLLGRWDLTNIGLLDDTHLRFFNGRLVDTTTAGAGWLEVAANDVVSPFSDQLFPPDAPALRPGTPLREMLRRIRMSADPYGETYQFVRRYVFDPDAAASRLEALRRDDGDDVFLSVVLKASPESTQALANLLGDIAGQAADDVEVLVSWTPGDEEMPSPPDGLTARMRSVTTPDGVDWRDAAVAEARGRYVTLLDTRTRLLPGYLAAIRGAVDACPGRVVQVGASTALTVDLREVSDLAAVADRLDPVALDPLDLVTAAPFGAVVLDSYAFPRQAWAANGLRMPVDDGGAAHTLLVVYAVELCGIVRSSERVTVVHPSVVREMSADLEFLQKHLNLHPMVIAEGAGSQMLALRQLAVTAGPEREALAQELAAVRDQVLSLSSQLRRYDAELTRLRGRSLRRPLRWVRRRGRAGLRRLRRSARPLSLRRRAARSPGRR